MINQAGRARSRTHTTRLWQGRGDAHPEARPGMPTQARVIVNEVMPQGPP